MNEQLFTEDGEFIGQIPGRCIMECSHSGDVSDAVRYWVEELDFRVPEQKAREYLKDFGCWDDLDICDVQTLNSRVLWDACCTLDEQNRSPDIENCGWFGVIG